MLAPAGTGPLRVEGFLQGTMSSASGVAFRRKVAPCYHSLWMRRQPAARGARHCTRHGRPPHGQGASAYVGLASSVEQACDRRAYGLCGIHPELPMGGPDPV